jgi:hypothetical protein
LKWLFDHSAKHWSSQDRLAYIFKGLQLFAMDGTTLRTHDTAENREHFGAQLYSSGAIASYPQVRGVTLTALSTHIVHSAAFGRRQQLNCSRRLISDHMQSSRTTA